MKPCTPDDELVWMFKEVHGDFKDSRCYLSYDDHETVKVMKGGEMCWSKSKVDIVFDYLIKLHYPNRD